MERKRADCEFHRDIVNAGTWTVLSMVPEIGNVRLLALIITFANPHPLIMCQ